MKYVFTICELGFVQQRLYGLAIFARAESTSAEAKTVSVERDVDDVAAEHGINAPCVVHTYRFTIKYNIYYLSVTCPRGWEKENPREGAKKTRHIAVQQGGHGSSCVRYRSMAFSWISCTNRHNEARDEYVLLNAQPGSLFANRLARSLLHIYINTRPPPHATISILTLWCCAWWMFSVYANDSGITSFFSHFLYTLNFPIALSFITFQRNPYRLHASKCFYELKKQKKTKNREILRAITTREAYTCPTWVFRGQIDRLWFNGAIRSQMTRRFRLSIGKKKT